MVIGSAPIYNVFMERVQAQGLAGGFVIFSNRTRAALVDVLLTMEVLTNAHTQNPEDKPVLVILNAFSGKKRDILQAIREPLYNYALFNQAGIVSDPVLRTFHLLLRTAA